MKPYYEVLTAVVEACPRRPDAPYKPDGTLYRRNICWICSERFVYPHMDHCATAGHFAFAERVIVNELVVLHRALQRHWQGQFPRDILEQIGADCVYGVLVGPVWFAELLRCGGRWIEYSPPAVPDNNDRSTMVVVTVLRAAHDHTFRDALAAAADSCIPHAVRNVALAQFDSHK
jgi:hypothetical protein